VRGSASVILFASAPTCARPRADRAL